MTNCQDNQSWEGLVRRSVIRFWIRLDRWNGDLQKFYDGRKDSAYLRSRQESEEKVDLENARSSVHRLIIYYHLLTAADHLSRYFLEGHAQESLVAMDRNFRKAHWAASSFGQNGSPAVEVCRMWVQAHEAVNKWSGHEFYSVGTTIREEISEMIKINGD